METIIQKLLLKRKLIKRWNNENKRIEYIIQAVNMKRDWTVYLIKHEIHDFPTLPYLHVGLVYKHHSDAACRDLRGIKLNNVEFTSSCDLSSTSFDYSHVSDASLEKVNLTGATFKSALLNNVVFEGAEMFHSNFSNAKLNNVNFSGAKARHINMTNTIICKCAFVDSDLRHMVFNDEPTFGHLLSILKINRGTKIREFIHDICHPGNEFIDYDFKRFVREQKYIDNVIYSWPFLSHIYYYLSDYGRNITRLGTWIILVWLLFGVFYSGYKIPYPISECHQCEAILTYMKPEIEWESENAPQNCFEPYFFSLSNILSVSEKNITPVDWKAKIFVYIEAFLGYLFLGLFINGLSAHRERGE